MREPVTTRSVRRFQAVVRSRISNRETVASARGRRSLSRSISDNCTRLRLKAPGKASHDTTARRGKSIHPSVVTPMPVGAFSREKDARVLLPPVTVLPCRRPTDRRLESRPVDVRPEQRPAVAQFVDTVDEQGCSPGFFIRGIVGGTRPLYWTHHLGLV